MKKIILLFIGIFVLSRNVLASTYYSEYKFVGHNEIELSDEVKKEEVKLYNTYSYKEVDMGYMLENNDYIKDKNDYKYMNIFTEEYNDNLDEQIILNIDEFNTNKIKINPLHLGLRINEIEVYYKNELLDYDYKVNDVTYISGLIDKDYDTSAIFLVKKSYIEILLDKKYNLKDLKIVLYTNEDKFKTKVVINEEVYLLECNNSKKHTILFDNTIKNIKYLYLNNHKLYRYYNKEKVVDNIYVKDGDNLILEDYKYINKYYIRDKLVLSDNSIIDEKYYDVNSFIEYSSGTVDINCIIDYSIPGIYECLYKLNDIEVKKDIIVPEKVSENNYISYIDDNVETTLTKEAEEKKTINEIKKDNNIIIKEENKTYNFIMLYFIIILIISIIIIFIIKRKKCIVEKV